MDVSKMIEYIPAALTKISTPPDFRSWRALWMSSLFERSHSKYLTSRLLLWENVKIYCTEIFSVAYTV